MGTGGTPPLWTPPAARCLPPGNSRARRIACPLVFSFRLVPAHVIQSRRVCLGEGHELRETKPAAVRSDEDALESPGRTVVAQHLVGAWNAFKSKLAGRRLRV